MFPPQKAFLWIFFYRESFINRSFYSQIFFGRSKFICWDLLSIEDPWKDIFSSDVPLRYYLFLKYLLRVFYPLKSILKVFTIRDPFEVVMLLEILSKWYFLTFEGLLSVAGLFVDFFDRESFKDLLLTEIARQVFRRPLAIEEFSRIICGRLLSIEDLLKDLIF